MEGSQGTDQSGFPLRAALGEEANQACDRPAAEPAVNLHARDVRPPAKRIERALQATNRNCGNFHAHKVTK